MITDRRRLTPDQKNYHAWPTIILDGKTEEERARVEKNLSIVHRYLDGDKVKLITDENKCSRTHIHNLVADCLKFHRDGRIFGERGLLNDDDNRDEYTRLAPVKKKTKNTPIGYAGAFNQLLEQHPQIKKMVIDSVLNRRQKGEINERRIPIGTALYDKFIKALRNAGLKGGDYPFNTGDQGRRSLYNFVNSLFKTHTRPMIMARYGKDAARRYGSGVIDQRLPVIRPFAQGQMDTHIIDEIDTVLIEHPWGGFTEVVTERCCVVFLMDVASRAILGYELVLSSKPSQEDILACIESSLTPWQPMELTVPELCYPENSGLPSGVFPELVGAQLDEILFDNDWAHLAFSVTDAWMDVGGTDVNAGTAGVMNDRAEIERLFKTLTDGFIKRNLNTVGGHPKDPLRDQPEKHALKNCYRLDHLKQVVDVAVATINASEHAGLGGRVPLII